MVLPLSTDRNPLQIESKPAEYILKDLRPGSVVANVNISADFKVLVQPLLYYIDDVTSKPVHGNSKKTSLLLLSDCQSAGAVSPLNFFCIRRRTGTIEITREFVWRAGDEFELAVHVTDSDPFGRTRNSGNVRLVSKDLCGSIQSLYSAVTSSCPRDGLVALQDTGPYTTPKQKLDISVSAVTAIIQAKVRLTQLQNPQTYKPYSIKLKGNSTKMKIVFGVDSVRDYDVIFVQPLAIKPGDSGLTVELSVGDTVLGISHNDTITLYGVSKNPKCPGANCLDPFFQWQNALNNLTSHVASADCSRDQHHMKLRFVACLGKSRVNLHYSKEVLFPPSISLLSSGQTDSQVNASFQLCVFVLSLIYVDLGGLWSSSNSYANRR